MAMKIRGVAGAVTGGGVYSGTYHWKTTMENIEVGDYVVAEVKGDYQVIQVSEITELPSAKATKWVFQKVDIDAARKMRSVANEVIKLKNMLDEKVKKSIEINKYKALAESDSEVALAVARLQELGML